DRRLAAVGGDDVNLRLAVAVGDEGQPPAVRRPARVAAGAPPGGEPGGAARLRPDGPQVGLEGGGVPGGPLAPGAGVPAVPGDAGRQRQVQAEHLVDGRRPLFGGGREGEREETEEDRRKPSQHAELLKVGLGRYFGCYPAAARAVKENRVRRPGPEGREW